MRQPYPSDLADQQWALIEPPIPVNALGRPRKVAMREVLNAIFYLNRSGCQWDMLPHDLPPKSTVYDHFAQWRDDGTWQKLFDAVRGPWLPRWASIQTHEIVACTPTGDPDYLDLMRITLTRVDDESLAPP